MTLTTSSTQFLLDDKPFRILFGAMHYFRVMLEVDDWIKGNPSAIHSV